MPNVTEQDLKRYLQVFHDTYAETVEAYVPAKFQVLLLRQGSGGFVNGPVSVVGRLC